LAAASNARLRALVDAHIDATARVLRRLGVPAGDVDDAVQKVFLTLANRLADVEVGAERAFLYRTALHVAQHARRTLARRREAPPVDDVVSAALTPEELVDRQRAAALLERVLDAMPDDLREPFVLHEVEELSMAEIAALLEVPPGTVASRLRRAREEFQARVARWRRGARP
jgi:RNA polymerase sigma-70 factor (ECF subfamily)